MNEISCITNKGKTAKNEWENYDFDFLWTLYSVYKKLVQLFFHTYVLTSSIFEQLNKYKNKNFFKNAMYIQSLNKVIKF